MLSDLRHGFRMLLKSPGFTTVAVLALALGIGANTAIFSLVDAVLLRQPAVEDPDRLVELYSYDSRAPFENPIQWTLYQDYVYYRDHNQVFSGLAASRLHSEFPLRLGERVEFVRGGIVSGNYFDVLGVKALLGRTFLPEEDRTAGTHPVAVISYSLWHRLFDSDSQAVGKQLILKGHSFTVIGVMPKAFSETSLNWSPEIWVPIMMQPQVAPTLRGLDPLNERDYRLRWFAVTGRLKPRVSLEQAQTALKTLARQLELTYPKTNQGVTINLLPMSEARIWMSSRGRIASTLGILSALVGLVLLIACANVANLQLARAWVRQREIAVRLSLGASRRRVLRQLLTESLLLSLLGATLGILLAVGLLRILSTFEQPFQVPIELNTRLDGRVLSFTLLLSLVTGVVFGLVPAWQASKCQLVTALKEGGASSGYRKSYLRSGLLIFQVILSMVSLIGAGLFVKDIQRLWAIHPGFNTDKVLLVSFNLYALGYSQDKGLRFYQGVVEKVRAIPGVKSVSLADEILPSYSQSLTLVAPEPETGKPEGKLVMECNNILPGYFEVMEIPILEGRDFDSHDDDRSPYVMIINETAARHFWPGQNPLGKRLKFVEDVGYSEAEVVGVVRDVKYKELWEKPRPYLFFPVTQAYDPDTTLHVKTSVDPLSLVAAVRRQVQALDANVPTGKITTLDHHLQTQLSQPRLAAWFSGMLGIVALILAASGIYALVAYAVVQRTREIGIRMALGAQKHNVLRLVMGQAMVHVCGGAVAGLILALSFGRLIAGSLHQVSPNSPYILVGITLLLAVVSLLACYIPARRATKVDPMVALRYE